jgi:hypothetical protein
MYENYQRRKVLLIFIGTKTTISNLVKGSKLINKQLSLIVTAFCVNTFVEPIKIVSLQILKSYRVSTMQ